MVEDVSGCHRLRQTVDEGGSGICMYYTSGNLGPKVIVWGTYMEYMAESQKFTSLVSRAEIGSPSGSNILIVMVIFWQLQALFRDSVLDAYGLGGVKRFMKYVEVNLTTWAVRWLKKKPEPDSFIFCTWRDLCMQWKFKISI